MKKALLLVLILSVTSFAFANYFVGLGGVGNITGIVGGLTLTYDIADFGEGHTVLMGAVGALGPGLGVSVNYTPFKIYQTFVGNYPVNIYLGAGAGLAFNFSGTYTLGGGATAKILVGNKFMISTTNGFSIGALNYYSDVAFSYLFDF